MPEPGSSASASRQRWAYLAGAAVIVGAAFVVLRPFLVPFGWGAILAFGSWPLYARLLRQLGGRAGLAAALMTLFMILVVVVPTVLLSLALAAEVARVVAELRPLLAEGPAALPGLLERIPLVGARAAALAREVVADASSVQEWVMPRLAGVAAAVTSLAGDLGRLLAEAAFALIALFGFYRYGDGLAARVREAVHRTLGERVLRMFGPMGETVRAVLYGTVFTALAQGFLLMLGAWLAGVRAPVLVGAITALLSLAPMGAPLVYVPVCGWLFVEGRTLAGGLLLAWSVLVVSTVDNLIRSWFLSGGAQVPFLLALFGVLGGLAAFGSIGLFAGPVAVALLFALWREWTTPPVALATEARPPEPR